jgi:hypothetical protein
MGGGAVDDRRTGIGLIEEIEPRRHEDTKQDKKNKPPITPMATDSRHPSVHIGDIGGKFFFFFFVPSWLKITPAAV